MASSLENETFSLPTAFFSSLIAALVSIIPHMVDRQAGSPPEEKCRLSCHIRIAKRQNKADQGATKVRRGTHPTDGSAYFYIRRNDEPRSNAGSREVMTLYYNTGGIWAYWSSVPGRSTASRRRSERWMRRSAALPLIFRRPRVISRTSLLSRSWAAIFRKSTLNSCATGE